MADIQATGELIKWGVNGVTLILMIIAASIAIQKKNNACLGVAIVGNLLVYFFTRSPLLCWIVSIACMIWAGKSKVGEKKEVSAPAATAPAPAATANQKAEKQEEKKVKCRFCKRSYSAEYNGCPYCKKK